MVAAAVEAVFALARARGGSDEDGEVSHDEAHGGSAAAASRVCGREAREETRLHDRGSEDGGAPYADELVSVHDAHDRHENAGAEYHHDDAGLQPAVEEQPDGHDDEPRSARTSVEVISERARVRVAEVRSYRQSGQ